MRRGARHAALPPRVAVRDVVGSLVLVGSVAVAQPVLDLLARNPEFFVDRRAPVLDVVVLAVVVALLAPLAVALVVGLLVRLVRPVGLVVHAVVLAVLVAAFVLPFAERLGAPLAVGAAAAAVAGVLAVVAFHRVDAARTLQRWGTAVPLAVLGLFLVTSPVGPLVGPASAEPGEARAAADPVPVVMVVFDALPVGALMDPDGTIDERLFPNFARLADAATWHRNTTTVHAWTHEVTPVMLTGGDRLPDAEPTSAAYPDNLFTLLDSAGYDVRARENVSWLCPPDICTGVVEDEAEPLAARLGAMLDDVRVIALHVVLPEPLTTGLPRIDQGWGDYAAADDAPTEAPDVSFDAWLEGLRPGERALHYHHLWTPHYPYEWLPDGRSYPDPRDTPSGPGHGDSRWTTDEFFVAQGYSRMLLQVGDADRLLGQLLDRLEATGLGEEAMLVVASDHGVGFTPGALLRHATPENLSEVAHVPLFVKLPGQDVGGVDDRPATIADIVPTIADRLGVADLWPTRGRSLLGEVPADRERHLSTAERYALPPGVAGVDAAAERKADWFGTAGGWDRVFRFGPHADLVGTDAAAAAGAPAARARVALDRPESYADVDPDGDSVPALLTGRIRADSALAEPPFATPWHLAVELDGEVVAIGKTFDHDGRDARFVAMLPPDAFVEGRNDVVVHRVVDGADGPVLQRLPER